ncbi:MAG: hypothetical protein NVSMB2_13750 [Chloroflexota bacterium]
MLITAAAGVLAGAAWVVVDALVGRAADVPAAAGALVAADELLGPGLLHAARS